MKLKTFFLLFLWVLVCLQELRSQQVSEIEFLPNSPDNLDNILIDVYTVHLNWSCSLIDTLTEVILSNDSIIIKATYNFGVAPAICTTNDTISIGVLAAGTYGVHFEFYYPNAPDSVVASKDTSLSISLHTSSSDIFTDDQPIKIYPNPTKGQFKITDLPQEPTRITVYNALGALVYDIELNGSDNFVIDLTDFPVGLYYLNVLLADSTLKSKIVKL